MNLFRLNEITKLPELTPEARGLEPFRSMYRRVLKGYPGDADGRNKVLNDKEVLFAYYSAMGNSNLRYLDDIDRIARLKAQLAMSDSWQPDELVLLAVNAIKDSQHSVTTEAVEEAVETIKTLRDYYKNLKAEIRNNPQKFATKPKLLTEIVESVSALKLAADDLKTLQEQYNAEMASMKTKKGRMMSKFETEDI